MIVNCPNCAVDFVVENRLIPEAGRTLKCSKCTHVWHFVPLNDEHTATPYARFGAALDALRRQHENAQMVVTEEPVPVDKKNQIYAAAAQASKVTGWAQDLVKKFWQTTTPIQRASLFLGGVFGLVASYALSFYVASTVVENHSKFSPVFNALGVKHSIPGEGLVMRDVRIKPLQTTKGDKRVEIIGVIDNHSLITRRLPMIEAFLDKGKGTSAGAVRLKLNQPTLDPGKSIPFTLTMYGWPPKDTIINVRFYLL